MSGQHQSVGSAQISAPHVLIIEDEQDTIDSLIPLMEGEGITVEGVTTLREALDRLKRGGIDCVLADLTLPDAAGVQVVLELRRADPKLPVVVHTGHYDYGVAARQTGATAVVEKPSTPDSIIWQVRLAISARQVDEAYGESGKALRSAAAKIDFLGKATGSGEV